MLSEVLGGTLPRFFVSSGPDQSIHMESGISDNSSS